MAHHRSQEGILQLVRATVAVSIGDVRDARDHREVAFPLHLLARGEGERAHGPPMEGPDEGDELLALGAPPPGQLHRRLDRLGPGVAEEDLLGVVAREHLAEALHEVALDLVIVIGPGEMHHLRGLVLDRLDHLGMAMADVQDRHPGGEIDEGVAVDVLYQSALGAFDGDRGGLGGCGEIFVVHLDYLLGVRTRRFHHYVRNLIQISPLCSAIWPTYKWLPSSFCSYLEHDGKALLSASCAALLEIGAEGALRALDDLGEYRVGRDHVLLVHDEDGVGVAGDRLGEVDPVLGQVGGQVREHTRGVHDLLRRLDGYLHQVWPDMQNVLLADRVDDLVLELLIGDDGDGLSPLDDLHYGLLVDQLDEDQL